MAGCAPATDWRRRFRATGKKGQPVTIPEAITKLSGSIDDMQGRMERGEVVLGIFRKQLALQGRDLKQARAALAALRGDEPPAEEPQS
jgi:hypothetical protein